MKGLDSQKLEYNSILHLIQLTALQQNNGIPHEKNWAGPPPNHQLINSKINE